ncbi:MAG: hypothetical protein WDN46_10955 [Methylocella sp.]
MNPVHLGLAAALTISLPGPAWAARPTSPSSMTATFGDPNAGHVDLQVAWVGKTVRAVEIVTHRVGAPGSRFQLKVDGRQVIPPSILSDKECHFDGGGSVCNITVDRKSGAFRTLLAAIRTGTTARVTIENAGNVAMDTDASIRKLATRLRRR